MRSIIALIAFVILFSNFAAGQDVIHPIPGQGVVGDGNLTIVYDPAAGKWWTDYPSDATPITTFELEASEDFFVGPDPDWKVGLFDLYTPTKAFKLDPAGFQTLGPANAKTGMSESELSQMLTVTGSFLGGGVLQPVDIAVIPEPSAFVLMILGAIIAVRQRRM